MNRKGIIVRLVDVVLNLLFGFMCISQVQQHSQIKIAETREFDVDRIDKEEIVFIGITNDGRFLVEDEQMVISDVTELQNYIIMKRNEFQALKLKMRIRIRSNWDTPIKYSLWLSELCDQVGVAKGLDVKKVDKKSH